MITWISHTMLWCHNITNGLMNMKMPIHSEWGRVLVFGLRPQLEAIEAFLSLWATPWLLPGERFCILGGPHPGVNMLFLSLLGKSCASDASTQNSLPQKLESRVEN